MIPQNTQQSTPSGRIAVTQSAGVTQVSARRRGVFATAWRFLFGERAQRLEERTGRVSAIGLILMLMQSATLVIVFGHSELRWLLDGTPTTRVMSAVSLAILVIGTIAADKTFLATIHRVALVARNRQTALLVEHVAYILLVASVEMITYGVAIYAIENNPNVLLSDQPIIPNTPLVLYTTIAARVLLIGYTYIHGEIIHDAPPLTWETARTQGLQVVGGYGQRLLDALQLTNNNIGDVFEAYARMSAPRPMKRNWLNTLTGAYARYQQFIADERRQREAMVEGLRKLSSNTDDEWQARLDAVQLAAAQQLSAMQDANARLVSEQLTYAILHLMQHGALPDEIAALSPALASVSLPPVVNAGRGSGAKRLALSASRAPRSKSERIEMFLAELGITAARKPAGKRGVFIKSSDVQALVTTPLSAERLRSLMREIGDGLQDGTALIAPVEALVNELLSRNILSENARVLWQKHMAHASESTPLAADDSGPLDSANVVPFTRVSNG